MWVEGGLFAFIDGMWVGVGCMTVFLVLDVGVRLFGRG